MSEEKGEDNARINKHLRKAPLDSNWKNKLTGKPRLDSPLIKNESFPHSEEKNKISVSVELEKNKNELSPASLAKDQATNLSNEDMKKVEEFKSPTEMLETISTEENKISVSEELEKNKNQLAAASLAKEQAGVNLANEAKKKVEEFKFPTQTLETISAEENKISVSEELEKIKNDLAATSLAKEQAVNLANEAMKKVEEFKSPKQMLETISAELLQKISLLENRVGLLEKNWTKEEILELIKKEVAISCDSLIKQANEVYGTEANHYGVGLVNSGNTCYQNAVLQCLTHSVPFLQHILPDTHSVQCERGKEGLCLLCGFFDLIEDLFTKKDAVRLSPYLAETLTNFLPASEIFEEQDTHEFLLWLLNEFKNVMGIDSAVVKQVFGGRLLDTHKCVTCAHISSNYEDYYILSLGIECVPTLSRALRSYLDVEILELKCDICKKGQLVRKKYDLEYIPPVSIFHLNRFKNNGEKIHKHIEFPTEIDMLHYFPPDNKANNLELKYVLKAVIVHEGQGLASGHYYSFIRVAPETLFEFSDAKVRMVSEDFVMSQQAYILFYAKDDTPWLSSFVKTAPIWQESANLENVRLIHEKREQQIERMEKDETRTFNLGYIVFRVANYNFVFQGVVLATSSTFTRCHFFWFALGVSLIAATLTFKTLSSLSVDYVRHLDDLDDKRRNLAGVIRWSVEVAKKKSRRNNQFMGMLLFLAFSAIVLTSTIVLPCYK